MGDTSVVPFDSSTSASRSTVFMGNAVINACDSVKKQLRKMAEANPAARGMPTAELLKAHFGPTRGEVIGIGEAGNAFEPGHPLGGRAAFWELMCAACEVEVDPETGEMTVHKLVLVSDVGQSAEPASGRGAGRRRRGDGARAHADGTARPRRRWPDSQPRIARLSNSVDQGCAARARHTPHRERGRSWTIWRERRRRRRHACGGGSGRRGNQSGGRRRRFATCRSRPRRSGELATKKEERKTNRPRAR